MSRLIITADDLGVNTQRSHGIFQCVEFGAVTGTSVIPNGTDSDTAARHARERKVPCGLQLTLTQEYPRSRPEDIATLLQANGLFLEDHQLRAALEEEQIEHDHLQREIRAQVEWFFDSYGTPTHICSTDHIHVHPMVIHALIPVLERYGIRFIRIPNEEPLPPFGFEVPEGTLALARRISEEARGARPLYEAAGIQSTDAFRGLAILGNASARNLRHLISRFPEGTIELMVHPGSPCSYGTPFDLDPQRQTELRMLMDESLKKVLAEKKVELAGWGDV